MAEDDGAPMPPAPNMLHRGNSSPESRLPPVFEPQPTGLRRTQSVNTSLIKSSGTRETHELLQELAYHTELSRKQLHELCERAGAQSQATATRFPWSDTKILHELSERAGVQSQVQSHPDILAVLAEFGLPCDPAALRAALSRLAAASGDGFQAMASGSSALSGRGEAPQAWLESQASPPHVNLSQASTPHANRRPSQFGKASTPGAQSRLLVRLHISRFLQNHYNRTRTVKLWQHEAQSTPVEGVGVLGVDVLSGEGEWYEKLCLAFKDTLSNLLDDNDTPIREVVFDLVSSEARHFQWRSPGHTSGDARLEGLKRAVRFFADAVLIARSQSDSPDRRSADSSEKSQWADCLSRVVDQCCRALQETWHLVWPGARGSLGGVVGHDSREEDVGSWAASPAGPTRLLDMTLAQSLENSQLFHRAAKSLYVSSSVPGGDTSSVETELWGPYLRQSIAVSKGLLRLAREMTLMAGLCAPALDEEGEELSLTVLRHEYRRVRRAFADLLGKQYRHIIEAWSARILKEVPELQALLDRKVLKSLLGAVIEWWRAGFSGRLRSACVGAVALWCSQEVQAGGRRFEDLVSIIPIFGDVVFEILRRELAVRPGLELSPVDEPRVRDIWARLLSEVNRYLESEWFIAKTTPGTARNLLPDPQLFQAPSWAPSMEFDKAVPKTAFLHSEIDGRFVVTRYVSRGAMGRVWEVEDKLFPNQEFPLCLKTFYCEEECQEMCQEMGMRLSDFKSHVLDELSQVDRWLTSKTRLHVSRHIVRVVKVLWNARVVRAPTTSGAASGKSQIQPEFFINGILMEFCEKGELTSYLWDEQERKPRAFDEKTAQFLFAQLTELLVELLAPKGVAREDEESYTFQSARRDTAALGLPTDPLVGTSPIGGQSAMEDSPPLGSFGVPPALLYFHNDIKLENLVISGTTLKLIDFQSLAPLDTSSAGAVQREMDHASMIYTHRHPSARGKSRHPSAPCTGPEAQAEGTMLWACGIVLVRLLCAELPQDWVYRHGGLGSMESLEKELPPGHCLLQRGDSGPRDLLERIFSREATPTIAEVLMHDWVREARMAWNQSDAHAPEPSPALKAALKAPASGSADRWIAWIQLTDMRVEGKDPPLAKVKEIIDLAVARSEGLFQQDGCPEACGHPAHVDADRAGVGALEDGAGAAAAPEDSFRWWQWRILVRTGDEMEEDALMASQPAVATALSADGVPQPGVLRRTESSVVAKRFAAGCFVVQMRGKACASEDEPESVWWLRVKWLPPTLPGCRSSLIASGLTAEVYQDQLRGLSGPFSKFVLLQLLLLDEVSQRAQHEAEQERQSSRASASSAAGLMLPGVGRPAGPMLPGIGARSR